MSDANDSDIVHRELDPDGEVPAIQVAHIVAELSDEDVTELQDTWSRFDHVIDDILSNPPAPEAQVEVTFSYEGYRITVEQNGHVRLVDVED